MGDRWVEDAAMFAVRIGIPPHRYYRLTLAERNAIVAEYAKVQKERWG